MRRLIQVLLLTLLVAALPTATLAQSNEGRVSLDMRATENGPSVCRSNAVHEKSCSFPSNTKEIYLVVDHQDLASSAIYVALQDDAGGQTIFGKSETLSGSGTRVYKVTGTDVYNEYVRQLVDKSGQLVSILGNASLSPYGRMQSAATLDAPLIAIIEQLQKFPLDESARSQLNTAKTHVEAARQKITAVMTTNMNADAQNQAVQEALGSANSANSTIQAAQSSLSGKSDLAFPDINVAGGRTQTAKITRNGSPAETLEWAVSSQGLPTSTPPATIGPTNTPGPTPDVSALTLTARAASPTPNPSATMTPAATATTAPNQPTSTPQPATAPTATQTAVVAQQTAATAQPTQPPVAAQAAQPTQPPAAKAVQAQATPPPAAQAAAAKAAAPPTAPSAAKAAVPTNPPQATAPRAAAQASPTIAKVAGGSVDLSGLTPVADGSTRVAGQSGGSALPLATIGLAVAALGLGGVALWMRRRV